MGKMRRTKKFAMKKRIISPKDARLKKNTEKLKEKEQKTIKALKDKVNDDIDIKNMYKKLI